MKKILWIAAAVAGLFAAASCQKETTAVPETEEAIAVLSVSVPQSIATKAYSDGKTATDLYYAVYDGKGADRRLLLHNDEPLKFENGVLTMEVEFKLVKNYPYDIVFWAQSPKAPYKFDQEAKTVTVENYTTNANDENRDAFYQLVEGYKVVPNPTKVDLYRPFAQINFGAKDYKEVTDLGLDMLSHVEIAGLPNVLNVLDRTATRSKDAKDAEFIRTAVPAASGEKLEINGDDKTYSYVSMNYVLAPDTKGVLEKVSGVFHYNDASISIPVENVPYQRNYRTNIIGEFFTGPAHFVVEIIPIYDKNSPYIENWPQKN